MSGVQAVRVRADNPGPMTLDGTNTWLVHVPGAPDCIVVDPGPQLPAHHDAVLAEAERRGLRIGLVLLTHGHPDHAEGAPGFAAVAGPSSGRSLVVRALDPAHRIGEEGLGDGDVVTLGDVEVRVLATPGHTGDSLCFTLAGDDGRPQSVLTGDTVLGRGTTVVAHPDGRLGDYLTSLERLRRLDHGVQVLPGHGDPLPDAAVVAERYLEHRQARLEQVRAAVSAGAATAQDVVEQVYADVDRALWPAATLSVLAQLEYLREPPGAGIPDSRAPGGGG